MYICVYFYIYEYINMCVYTHEHVHTFTCTLMQWCQRMLIALLESHSTILMCVTLTDVELDPLDHDDDEQEDEEELPESHRRHKNV